MNGMVERKKLRDGIVGVVGVLQWMVGTSLEWAVSWTDIFSMGVGGIAISEDRAWGNWLEEEGWKEGFMAAD